MFPKILREQKEIYKSVKINFIYKKSIQFHDVMASIQFLII